MLKIKITVMMQGNSELYVLYKTLFLNAVAILDFNYSSTNGEHLDDGYWVPVTPINIVVIF